MLLTLAALVVGLVFLEAAMSHLAAFAWRTGRWFLLPLYGLAIADIVPLGLFAFPVFLDTVASYLLALAFALLVTTAGHFRDAHWRGPTAAQLARTGRRSVYERTAPRRPAPLAARRA